MFRRRNSRHWSSLPWETYLSPRPQHRPSESSPSKPLSPCCSHLLRRDSPLINRTLKTHHWLNPRYVPWLANFRSIILDDILRVLRFLPSTSHLLRRFPSPSGVSVSQNARVRRTRHDYMAEHGLARVECGANASPQEWVPWSRVYLRRCGEDGGWLIASER